MLPIPQHYPMINSGSSYIGMVPALMPCAQIQKNFQDPLLSFLTPLEQMEYSQLSQFFVNTDDRNKRNMGLATFMKHLNLIHNFVCRNDNKDNIRGLICGIQFGKGSLLINTGRLRTLMRRSKSCMNGCFQKLGFETTKPSEDLTTVLHKITPGIQCDVTNPRKWCVRRETSPTPSFSPNIFLNFCSPYDSRVSHDSSSSPLASSSEDESPNPLIKLDIMNLLNHH